MLQGSACRCRAPKVPVKVMEAAEPGRGLASDALCVLREQAEFLRKMLERVREGESGERQGTFDQKHFWDTFDQACKATSHEATKLSLAFSNPPLPSAEACQKLSDSLKNAVLATVTAYYRLPKRQGMTLRKAVRNATAEVVEGTIQLTDVILKTPLDSISQEQLMSTGGVWEACKMADNLPRDNQIAVQAVLNSYLGIVKDALEEMEQAIEDELDPFADILEDEELGARGNQDMYWSDADRQVHAPCLGLMKASKACLKKVVATLKSHGKVDTPDNVAQLDDLADIANEISPSVDELALSMYPPMNHLPVRLNAAKLASVLKKFLEVTKSSHICPESEAEWVQFLDNAVDHNMNKIKELTQWAL